MTDITTLDPEFWLIVLAILQGLAFGAILYRLTSGD